MFIGCDIGVEWEDWLVEELEWGLECFDWRKNLKGGCFGDGEGGIGEES